MQGDQRLIDTLNELLADELTAVSQYIVHAEMSEDWGYDKLHDRSKRRAIDEMGHAERLIGRILSLDGVPRVGVLNSVHIGADIPQQLENDRVAEAEAIVSYNKAIALAGEVLDHVTRELLVAILQDEDRHLDEIEEMQGQVEQLGLANFLIAQLGPASAAVTA
ncbi:MAG: bacterioferritin [Coriobacteriia bacterium]|nr:bacterioferritin [Coriobacteriia bacterium]